MNLFSELEKFGLDAGDLDLTNIFTEDKKKAAKAEEKKEEVKPLTEEDFLLDKSFSCPICDMKFINKAVRSSKLRRLPPDKDLRPRYQYIDTLKYDVVSCPHCGYTAMTRYFSHVSTLQHKLIVDGVCAKYRKNKDAEKDGMSTYSYDTAIERYKLALFNTMVKKGAVSEKAYTCLKIAWLYRGKCEEMVQLGVGEESESLKQYRQEEKVFYEQAYEGFLKALETERMPICGMDQNIIGILVAEMAFSLGKNDVASKYVSEVLVSRTANRNTKDKAFELKEEIVKAIHRASK